MKRQFLTLSSSVLFAFLMLGTTLLALPPAEAQLDSPATTASLPARPPQLTLVDDLESHHWIGEPWGNPISLTWVTFDGRDVLQIDVAAGATNWALLRTDAFSAENWDSLTAVTAAVYKSSGAAGVDLKLEVRGLGFDPVLVAPVCVNVPTGLWHTCTWLLPSVPDLSTVSHLSLLIEQLSGQGATLYVDDLRLVTGAQDELWDAFAKASRLWFYSGNWYDWNSARPFGLEPVSHRETTPASPAGALFLQWDPPNGVDPTATTAEVGTALLDGLRDWRPYTHIAADVWMTDPDAAISVFLWDAEGATTPVDRRGFGTPTRRTGVANSWQRLTWDLPWPSWFDPSDIDELKFVVNDLASLPAGMVYIDNITLVTSPFPDPLGGLPYIFEDFNDLDLNANDFGGNWGLFNAANVFTTFDTTTYSGTWGAALRVDYDLVPEAAAGIWQSIWGSSAVTATSYLDFTDIYGALVGDARDLEQIHFWVRGSGLTTATHQVKVELKDTSGASAYRYVPVADDDTSWRRIVLDADVSNGDFWSYSGAAPDPTRMKELVFVVESFFNEPQGHFYLDHITFVDADDEPFELTGANDEAFLDLVTERTFLYFLDRYDPNTGLTQDRSTQPQFSTAATGFGLTALAIGDAQGWITRATAVNMVTRTLHTLVDGQSPGQTVTDVLTMTNGYRGFFYHFLDENGQRGDTGSELSPVDTAILLFGAITAQEHFSDVNEIALLVDEIYARVDWAWMLDDGPAKNVFYLAWQPECGGDYQKPAPGGGCFSNFDWGIYTDEVILINLLAIGAPANNVSPDVLYAWDRTWGTYADEELVQSWNGSAFTYNFAHLWVDFDMLGTDAHPSPTLRVDWWENSVAAMRASRQFASDHQDDVCDDDDNYRTYGPDSWGLTAADGPDGMYHAYGAPPAYQPVEHDGTIAVYGAGSAMIFLPDESLSALKHYFTDTDLWRYRFGFGDAYNLDPPGCAGPWYNHTSFGIDQGPLLLALANHRDGFVWNTLVGNANLRAALCAVGYRCYYLPQIEVDTQ